LDIPGLGKGPVKNFWVSDDQCLSFILPSVVTARGRRNVRNATKLTTSPISHGNLEART